MVKFSYFNNKLIYKTINLILFIVFFQITKSENNYFKNGNRIFTNKNKKNNFGRHLREAKLNFYFEDCIFEHFPTELEDYKQTFSKAMGNAQDKLSKIFTIDIDGGVVIDSTFNYLTEFNIPCWNTEKFSQININFDTESSNYFVFFNFANIHGEASSRIVFCDARPSGGVITFNPEKIKSKISTDYLTSLLIHHLIHLLGFHIDDENEIFVGNIKEVDGKYYVKIENNPILYEYIRTYFNCPDFSDDIELKKDEDNNIHWPKRLFLGDIMTQFDYPEEQVLSGFTLAFLEDYWYINVIKSYTGGLMRFGKHKGCKFLTEKCGDNIENEEYQKTFANEFYLPANIENLPDYFMPSCSSGRLSKTVHKLYEISGPKADYHEFYSNNIVGKESANYCPISEYDDSSRTNTYIGLCSKESTGID